MKHTAIAILASGLAGLVFGIGLIVSGMFNPAKVLAFLDLAGPWDPSLALVMVGAVAIAAIGFALARRRGSTLLGSPLQLGSARKVDRRLILGSLVFGAGWGLVGFCPARSLSLSGLAKPRRSRFSPPWSPACSSSRCSSAGARLRSIPRSRRRRRARPTAEVCLLSL